jgi:hypothetical protein
MVSFSFGFALVVSILVVCGHWCSAVGDLSLQVEETLFPVPVATAVSDIGELDTKAFNKARAISRGENTAPQSATDTREGVSSRRSGTTPRRHWLTRLAYRTGASLQFTGRRLRGTVPKSPAGGGTSNVALLCELQQAICIGAMCLLFVAILCCLPKHNSKNENLEYSVVTLSTRDL